MTVGGPAPKCRICTCYASQPGAGGALGVHCELQAQSRESHDFWNKLCLAAWRCPLHMNVRHCTIVSNSGKQCRSRQHICQQGPGCEDRRRSPLLLGGLGPKNPYSWETNGSIWGYPLNNCCSLCWQTCQRPWAQISSAWHLAAAAAQQAQHDCFPGE